MFGKLSVNFTLLLCSLFIAMGTGASGYFVGRAIGHFKTHDRTVVVKGLSEREVKADLAVWTLNFKNRGPDLAVLEKKLEQDKQAIVNFFKQRGFDPGEVRIGAVHVTHVTDNVAKEGGHVDSVERFITDGEVTLRTSEVDLVSQSTVYLSELLRKGIIASGVPAYYYTKFPQIRPEMIAEATKSARSAAAQFAADAGSKVGNIRSANQGTFSISARDSYGEGHEHGEAHSLNKKVRVVSTVTFSLE